MHNPATDGHRLLTHAVAPKHGTLRCLTYATMHNMQIELDQCIHDMKTATQEGRKTCWAAMQYAEAFDAVDAVHATMISCAASGVMAGFTHAWGGVSPPRQDSTIQ